MEWDYNRLEPKLSLGATPQDAAQIRAAGIETILNLCDFARPAYTQGLDTAIQLTQVPFEDGWPVPEVWLTRAALELAYHHRSGAETLVHCLLGRSRSPTIVAIYWMARDNISWAEAVRRIEKHRHTHLRLGGESKLITSQTRDQTVHAVRQFLAGDLGLLAEYRQRSQEYRELLENRPGEFATNAADWQTIDQHLIMGVDCPDEDHLAKLGIAGVLSPHVPTSEARESTSHVIWRVVTRPGGDITDLKTDSAVDRYLGHVVSSQRRIFVQVHEAEALLSDRMACRWIQQRFGFDLPAAIWYCGSRRLAILSSAARLLQEQGR